MEQDCDEAERLLIEVTARPEHYSAVHPATLTARAHNVSNRAAINNYSNSRLLIDYIP